jgi:hypothetical protein
MFNVPGSKIIRWLVVALLAVATASPFVFSGHSHHGSGIVAAQAYDASSCGHAALDSGKSTKSSFLCCDACLLGAAPIHGAPIAHVVYALEIATQLAFELSLGRRLDHRPEDLRSRAPPRAA